MRLFFLFLFILLIGILSFYYIKLVSLPEHELYINKEEIKIEPIEYKKLLVDKFSIPAREVYFNLKFKTFHIKYIYKLKFKLEDKFDAYNLMNILDNYNYVYSVSQKRFIYVFIMFDSLKKAKNLLQLLHNYNLNYELEKIEKRV